MKLVRMALIVTATLALLALPAFGEDPAPPPPPWTGGVGFGLGITSGNTSTANFNLNFSAKYDPKTKNLFTVDGFYLWGETEHVTSTNKGGMVLRYDRALSDRTYFFARLGYVKDQFAGITYLISPTVGVGVHAVKNDKVDLQFLAGVGGAFEKDLDQPSNSSVAVNAGESFDWKISQTATLSQHLGGLWKTDSWSDSYYHFDVSVSAALTKRSELKVTALVDYKNLPPLPTMDQTDSALMVALVMKF